MGDTYLTFSLLMEPTGAAAAVPGRPHEHRRGPVGGLISVPTPSDDGLWVYGVQPQEFHHRIEIPVIVH